MSTQRTFRYANAILSVRYNISIHKIVYHTVYFFRKPSIAIIQKITKPTWFICFIYKYVPSLYFK